MMMIPYGEVKIHIKNSFCLQLHVRRIHTLKQYSHRCKCLKTHYSNMLYYIKSTLFQLRMYECVVRW